MKLVPICFITDAMGIYLPKNFVDLLKDCKSQVEGVKEDIWKILEAGPYEEHYWDAWEEVERNAIVSDVAGNKYRVHQDGDCWLIPVGMEWDETTNGWIWPHE